MRVSVMLDSNGSNTTAVAAVAKLPAGAGGADGARSSSLAGLGPGGHARRGSARQGRRTGHVTTRRAADGASARHPGAVRRHRRRGDHGRCVGSGAALEMRRCSSTPVRRASAWSRRTLDGRAGLRVAVDVNAVPPLGVEGIEVTDNAVDRGGVTTFGALGVGNLKMKIHKACIARLFESNDHVLDAETIAEIARGLTQAIRSQ